MSTVPELHDMSMVCLLKAVTPRMVTNTFVSTLVVDNTRYYGWFAVLQAKFKCHPFGLSKTSFFSMHLSSLPC